MDFIYNGINNNTDQYAKLGYLSAALNQVISEVNVDHNRLMMERTDPWLNTKMPGMFGPEPLNYKDAEIDRLRRRVSELEAELSKLKAK